METTIPRRRRARVFSLAAVIALVALLLPVTAGIAFAHNHTVDATCTGGLSVNLSAYASGGTNTLNVWIDGVQVVGPDYSFGTTYSKTFSWSPTTSHTWEVKVHAYDSQSYSFDQTGTVAACKAHLILIKNVAGGSASPSSWTLTAASTGHTGINGTTPVSGIVDPATYTLSESGSVANYTNGTSWSCLPTVTLGAAPLAVSNSVTLNAGDDVTCTITNTYSPPNGSLELDKVLTGGPAQYTGPFTIHYVCGTVASGDKSVYAGTPVTIPGLPTGTSCTISEPSLPTVPGYTFGAPTFDPSNATVTIGNNTTVKVTTYNTLTQNTGSLELDKVLTGGPAQYTGPFTIHYVCGTVASGDKSVYAGTPVTIPGLPTGTSCTISEPSLPTVPGYTFGAPTFDPSNATVTIGNNTTVKVTTYNTLTQNTGSLELDKVLTGGPAQYTGPFTIHYVCGTVASGDKSVYAGTPVTIPGLPTGTSCTISEPSLPTVPGYTFGAPTFDPSNATVTIGNNTTVKVTTYNTLTLDVGTLTLAKALSGGPAQYTGPFAINYDCGTVSGTVNVAAGASSDPITVPAGASCTISETLPDAPTGYSFGTPTFDPSNKVTIVKNQNVTVTTNNTLTRDTAGLKLTKILTGGPAGYDGEFTINYDCGEGFTGHVTLTAGTSQTISGIPTGTQCTVSEPTLPTVPGYTFGTPTFDPENATVTIVKGETVTVTTNNTLTPDPGGLTINKTVTGYAGFSGSFPVSVSCTGETSPRTGTISYPSPGSITFSGIAAGSICTVTEGTLPAAPGAWTWGAIAYSGDPATIPPGGIATVGITNTLIPPPNYGYFYFTKTVNGNLTGWTGGSFPFTVTCNGQTTNLSLTLPASGGSVSSQVFGPFNPGVTCSVAEGTLPAAGTDASWVNSPSYAPSSGPVTIAGSATATVTVTNTRSYVPPQIVTPSPSPTSTVEAATSRPHITPPPTSSVGGTTGGPSSGTWVLLLALAGLLGSLLLLTPTPARARRKR